MPILQYETRVAPDGCITLPPIPEYHGRKVVVRVEDNDDWPTPTDEQLENMYAIGRDWSPDPTVVRQFFESRTIAVEMTDEAVEELKHERRMRKIR